MLPLFKIFGLNIYKERDVENFFEELLKEDMESSRRFCHAMETSRRHTQALREIRQYIDSIKGNRNGKSYAFIPKIERIIEENVNKKQDWSDEQCLKDKNEYWYHTQRDSV